MELSNYNEIDKRSYEKGYSDGQQDAAYQIINAIRYASFNISESLEYLETEEYAALLEETLNSFAEKFNVEDDGVF
jgi:hypothetical protein